MCTFPFISANGRVYFNENFPKEVMFVLERARWMSGARGWNFREEEQWDVDERRVGSGMEIIKSVI